MGIRLLSIVRDGMGTEGKAIFIDNEEDYIHFQELIQRGSNLWPDAPACVKQIADLVTSGRIMQSYKD